MKYEFVKSPLNYTGGKFKLLAQILPLFPDNITTFYDLFCGGANVCANVDAKLLCASDLNKDVVELFNFFLSCNLEIIEGELLDLIESYGLSDSSKCGYAFYGCDSSKGLSSFNKYKFSKLRDDYNNLSDCNSDLKNKLFFLLIVFGFNNQIRFNRFGHFNMPAGKRDFNSNVRRNLKDFITSIKSKNIKFSNVSAFDVDIKCCADTFVYADPPYLISTATYNESGGWTEVDEKRLLERLKSLDLRGVKFALSNVLVHKGKENDILSNWIQDNKFQVCDLNFSYKNSSYQGKNTDELTKEILVMNYKR